jgi:hypothetical protein
MAATPSPEELATKARFVFRGTVQRLNATNVAEVRDTSRTAIVKVNEIIQAPQSLRHSTGREVTVQLHEGSGLKVGDETVFFTEAWMFGNTGVAVKSLGHHPPGPKTAALRANQDPVANLHDRDTRTHYNEAELALTGRVTSIRIPATSDHNRPPSEHDPQWREAVVEIEKVHKGKLQKKEVVVRFPASADRMWYRAPKLEANHRGHFLLHKWSPELARKTLTETAAPADTYTILHPEDFERLEHPGPLSRLLSSQA